MNSNKQNIKKMLLDMVPYFLEDVRDAIKIVNYETLSDNMLNDLIIQAIDNLAEYDNSDFFTLEEGKELTAWDLGRLSVAMSFMRGFMALEEKSDDELHTN